MADHAKENALIEECRALAPRAYAPYSKFHVAAAVRTADGTVYRGINMENASYGVTMCAEIGALMAANLGGDLANIRALYVVGGTVDSLGALKGKNIVAPCGRCRQLICEAASLCGHDIDVICSSGDGTERLRSTIRKLLPHSFGADTLIDHRGGTRSRKRRRVKSVER